jgi:hypothetical protein
VIDRPDDVRGTSFSLRLPLRVPTADAARVAASAEARGGGPSSPHKARLAADGRGTILVKLRVLVEDDSEGNRRLARRMLQQLGCRVIEASDGDEVRACAYVFVCMCVYVCVCVCDGCGDACARVRAAA